MFLNVEGPPLLPWKASVLFERNENSWQGVKELGSEGDFFLTEEYRWTEHTGFLLSHRFTQITRARRFLLSHRFTQMNRTHSIPQRPCGRQISQNLTAIFSWNALWSLYAEGLLWARNVRKNALLTLCALWEKKISFVRDIAFKLVTLSICYHVAKLVYLLPCLLVHLRQNLFTCYPVYLSAKDIPCLPVNSSTFQQNT